MTVVESGREESSTLTVWFTFWIGANSLPRRVKVSPARAMISPISMYPGVGAPSSNTAVYRETNAMNRVQYGERRTKSSEGKESLRKP